MPFDHEVRLERGAAFRDLHSKGAPFALFNVWDVQSARLAETAGAPALGTSSWAIADSLGLEDGEVLAFEALASIVEGITRGVALPVSVDMERGYAPSLEGLKANTRRLIEAGVVGVNLEDGLAGGGLRGAGEQAARIAAVAEAAHGLGVDLFINARTDAFFVHGETAAAADLAVERAMAYAQAGASGLFAPGLGDPDLIRRICGEIDLPVNIMIGLGREAEEFGALGVARLSLGPAAYLAVKAAATETISREIRRASAD